jgi:uncharacterized lipoprotein YmbA
MRLQLHSREMGKGFEMTARSFAVLSLLSSVLCLPSCSLPEAQADPTRFFVLSTPAANAGGNLVASAPAIHVRAIELASYIRSRPLIVRKSENEVEFREFARWGEPLEQGIARVLREELLARGAASAVAISGVRATNRPYDFELTVRVLACEGTTGGAVIFRAVWELVGAGGKNAPSIARGDFHPEGLKWDGKTETSLVAELSKAVAGLAGEIAGGLKQ